MSNMQVVTKKATASAAVAARRTVVARRTAAISTNRSSVAGLRRLNKVGARGFWGAREGGRVDAIRVKFSPRIPRSRGLGLAKGSTFRSR